MNETEAKRLLRLVAGYHPGFQATAQTPAVWAHALADLSEADATRAVHAHYAVAGPWITIADIRRRVVSARGLLPPDPEVAYGQAVAMNAWLNRRIGPEPEIHPTAIAAARQVRWSTFDGLEGAAHRRFLDAYAPMATRASEQALTTPLPRLEAELRAPKALPGGAGVEAAEREALAIEPIDKPRAEAVKAQIRAADIGRLPAPKADYEPPTDIERQRQLDELRRWAAENGYPLDESGAA